MRRSKVSRAILAVLIMVLAAWWLWPKGSCDKHAPTGGDFELLANRIWIDHIPTNEREKINVFLMLDEPTFGMFSKSSAYEGDWAAFEWSMEKGLVLKMLQNETKHRVNPKLATGARCAPFDHCLKLGGSPRGPKKYGSMEDWVINSADQFDARQFLSGILDARQ